MSGCVGYKGLEILAGEQWLRHNHQTNGLGERVDRIRTWNGRVERKDKEDWRNVPGGCISIGDDVVHHVRTPLARIGMMEPWNPGFPGFGNWQKSFAGGSQGTHKRPTWCDAWPFWDGASK